MKIPFLIQGTVYEAGGTTPLRDTAIVAVNMRNGERLTSATDGQGVYVIDGANFSSGVLDKDRVRIMVIKDIKEGTEAAKTLARITIKQIKDHWRDKLRGKLFNAEEIGNNPIPYDEPNGIFRHHTEFRFNFIDPGE